MKGISNSHLNCKIEVHLLLTVNKINMDNVAVTEFSFRHLLVFRVYQFIV